MAALRPTAIGGLEFTVDDALIEPLNNGHLKCSLDATYWCKHIESAIKDSKDANAIWELEQYATTEWIPLEIPIIPTSNQWAPVRLTLCKINSVPMISVVYPGPSADQSNFLGYISEGEGRMIIRSMVWDWFQGAVDPTSIECKSPSHKFAQQMRWERDMQDERSMVAQFWSVWSTSACLGCTFDSSVATDPDLIPDDPKTASPWARTSYRMAPGDTDEHHPFINTPGGSRG
jgi:hypothetical protein